MHPAEHMMQPHPAHAMMGRQHPMPAIPVPISNQQEVGPFSGTPPPHFHPMNSPHMRPMTPEQQHHMMAAAMQHRAVEQQHQQQQQQQQQQVQQMEQQQMVQQMKMKQTQDMAQMFQQMQKMQMQGQNVTLTPEQIAQFMQCMANQQLMANQGMSMIPGGQNMVAPPWMQQGAQQQEMMMNPVSQSGAELPPQMMHQVPMGQHVHPMFLAQQQAQMQSFMAGQQLPGQPTQPLTGQRLPGQPVPGLMPGGLSAQHFMQGQIQSQQIMIPRPIHPEMGNISNITPPQNTPLLDPALGIPPRQFGINTPAPAAVTTQPHLAPVSDVRVSSPSLQLEDSNSSAIETSATEPVPTTSSVTSQDAYQSSAPPITTTKSTEVPAPSSEAVPPSSEAVPLPAAKTSSASETPVKQTKTPGLIRLPPQLPTEEDLLKSPDAAGTPVNMKKNYWQNRQKSSESGEKKALPETEQIKEELETTESPPVLVSEPKKVKRASPDPADIPLPPEKPVPPETPKKKSDKQIKPRGFNLSDLGDLVTKTVTHNNNIPKTDIRAAADSGSVEVVLNQGYRRTHSPCQARAVDTREKGDTWRPLTKAAKPEPEPASTWRAAQDNPPSTSNPASSSNPASTSNPASSSASTFKVLEEDPERTKALQEAEAMNLKTGHQIQYAIEKLQKESRIKSVSESSSKSVIEEVAGEEAWYDEEDEDRIDCFDLTI